MDEKRVQQKPTESGLPSIIKSVKEAFHDEPAKFNEFLKLCEGIDETDSSITVDDIKRIKELLEGHQELFLAFKDFLPEHLKTILEPEDEEPQQKKLKLVDMDTRRVQEKPFTVGEALSFIISVQEALHDEPAKYDEFLKLGKGLHEANRSTQVDAIKRIIELLEGHQELILAFKNFFPGRLETIIEPEDEEPTQKKVPSFEDALSFAKKLRVRFQDKFEVCKSFLEIIKLCKNGSKSFTEVSQEVANLFGEHLDLYQEFLNLMPHLSATS